MRKLGPRTVPPVDIEPDLTPYLWRPTPVGELPSEDGVPLESHWHVLQIALLMESLTWHWRDRPDSFVGGNMFIYYDEALARRKYFRGPDVFAVKDGVSANRDRKFWAVWEENGRFPDVIIELMSPSTRKKDLTIKKQVYEENFRTRDFVAYDPASREFFVWRKKDGRFQRRSANREGRYALKDIGLWLGPWQGTYLELETEWLRFFDAAGNLVMTRAEAESTRADAEKTRADALAKELAELKARVAKPGRSRSEG